jgi:exosortase
MAQQASTILDPVQSSPTVLKRIPTRWAVAGGVLVIAFLPLLLAHGRQLWLRPHYQFFPLALVGAAVLAWPALTEGPRTRAGSTARTMSFGLVGLSWLLLAGAVVMDSPWAASVACLILLAAAPLGIGGWPYLRALLPALGFLLLVIPPPFGMDSRLVSALQTLTAKASSHILDYINVFHYMEGNVVVTSGKRYMVEEACSGIHSLFSIVACTLFYALWAHVHWFRAICLLVAAVFWVMVQNTFRVVMIAYVGSRWGWDLSAGWPHYALDFVLFGCSLLLLASTDRFLRFLGESFSWRDETRAFAGKSSNRPSAAVDRGAPIQWLPAGLLGGAFAVLAVPQLADLVLGLSSTVSGSYATSINKYNEFTVDTLPATIAGWKQAENKKPFETRDSGHTLGEFSRTWNYEKNGRMLVVSFDYPFPIWHDLRGCYHANGWTTDEDHAFQTHLSGHEAPFDCWWVTYSQPFERHAYLWFTEFDQAGEPVAPALTREEFRWKPRLDAFRQSWQRVLGMGGGAAPRNSAILQVQVFAAGYEPLTADQQGDIEKFFTQAADQLRKRCVAVQNNG